MFKLCLIVLCFALQNIWSQEQFTVYFDSDQYRLNSLQTQRLQQFIERNPKGKVLSINGFTDEDGSIAYNDTLSQKRVNTIFELIQNKIEIRDDFKKEHFGKLHPQLELKAKNRRVTLFYLTEAQRNQEAVLIPETLPVNETAAKINFPEQIFVENPEGSKTEMNLDLSFMQSIAEAQMGDKIVMKDLNFVVNTFAVVKESRTRMFELLVVMQQLPNLIIEIEGHVCCTPSDRTDLSTKRAKSIKNFLIYYGIDPQRVTYKGYGSTQPKYAIPEQNEEEKAANRRVEIKIIAK